MIIFFLRFSLDSVIYLKQDEKRKSIGIYGFNILYSMIVKGEGGERGAEDDYDNNNNNKKDENILLYIYFSSSFFLKIF